ncbi:OLC1v1015197C1 [Oldenlandia corymbosa var. corymbosa]|uniref:OLC1v1015197C1 n=1 Tax=Oldenlandia corymbosa var. corymbosa TaxID=529605 RepID=A0AAV1E698_OLDCO|nr:OLC1v1015197C1 [Oldenlandia corymbosa var. corymbosa]
MKKNSEEVSDPDGGDDSASAHRQCTRDDRQYVSMNQKNTEVMDDTLVESNASLWSSRKSFRKDISSLDTRSVGRGARSGQSGYTGKGDWSAVGVSGSTHGSLKWVPKGAHSGKLGYAGKGNSPSVADSGSHREFNTRVVPGIRVHSGEAGFAGKGNSCNAGDSDNSSKAIMLESCSVDDTANTREYDTAVVSRGAQLSQEIGFPDEGNYCSVSDLGRTSKSNTWVVPSGGAARSGKIKYAGKGNSYSVAVSGSNSEYTSGGAHAGKTGNADKRSSHSVAESNRVRELSQLSVFDDGVKVFNIEESSLKRVSGADVQAHDSVFCYDICPFRNRSSVKLNLPLHLKNREIRNEKNRADGLCIQVLRPGMLLLKHFISLNDQVKVIRSCRELGVGPGGFYQPGYQDGAKLSLKMMCLGKNWDPETSKYGDLRPCDRSKPPPIPDEFHDLVLNAIKASHSHLRNRGSKTQTAEDILPSMTPNICIVNFYTKTGKLGLHQVL